MTLKEQVDLDMQNVFMNTDEFAESIVYTPKCGTAKTIPAIVDRFQPDAKSQDQARVLQKTATIIIHNDATNGVTEIDTKGDKVTFAPIVGQATVDWDIVRILESSESHFKLEVIQ